MSWLDRVRRRERSERRQPTTDEIAEQQRMIERLKPVMDQNQELLRALPGVHGFGIGWRTVGGRWRRGEWAIVVYVENKLPETTLAPGALIPKELVGEVDGEQIRVPTDVVQGGPFFALAAGTTLASGS